MKRIACSVTSSRHIGFSMIEMMVVLAITTILSVLAVPSFAGLFGQTRVTTGINDFFSAVNATRSEALSRGIRVDMVPNTNNQWASGWIVFVDSDADQTVDVGETVLLKRDALPSDIIINETRKEGAFLDPKSGKRYLAFTPSGYARWNGGGYLAGSIEMKNDHARRKLVLSMLGRARICTPDVEGNCN